MKIAITGVAGFIGSNLAAFEGDPRFRFQLGSILDPDTLQRLADGAGAMVHLAAGKIPRYGDALDTLVTNGDTGRQTRSFTDVSDLVEGFVRAVDTPEADGQMLNVGHDRAIERRIPDNRLATRVLGYTPAVALEDGLVRTIAWQREAMARSGRL